MKTKNDLLDDFMLILAILMETNVFLNYYIVNNVAHFSMVEKDMPIENRIVTNG